MNKLTKVLSVFIIAGAIGTGVAGVAGCTKKDNHTHAYTYTANSDGKTHNGACDCGKDPITNQNHVDENNDKKCDLCLADLGGGEESDKLQIPAAAQALIVEGVGDTEVQLSETKKSHSIDKSAVKVYFADGSGNKLDEVPAANLDIALKDPDRADCEAWDNLKADGEYSVVAKIKNCKLAEGSTAELEDFVSTVTVRVNNGIVSTSLVVKEGTLTQRKSVQDRMTSTWKYEVTRENGDKEDVAANEVKVSGLDTNTVAASAQATITYGTIASGKVTYSITENPDLRTKSYAVNFANVPEGVVAADTKLIEGNGTTLTSHANDSKANVNSSGSGETEDRYFPSRFQFGGGSFTSGNALQKDRYLKLVTDGAAKLTIYWNTNGSAGRGIKVFSKSDLGANGIETVTPAMDSLYEKKVDTKDVQVSEISLPKADEYYITTATDKDIYFFYIQVDTEFEDASAENIPLADGDVSLAKVTVSHPNDAGDVKFKQKFTVGDTFSVDANYKVEGLSVTQYTGKKTRAVITENLKYYLGETELVPGTTVLSAEMFAILGDQTITVKVGEETVTGSYTINVESAISGVTGITASLKSTLVTEVADASATINLVKSDIELALVGENASATITPKTITMLAKDAEEGATPVEITDTAVQVAPGEYVITVVATVADSVSGGSVDFTTTCKLLVTVAGSLQNVSIGSDQVKTLEAKIATSVVLFDTANAKVTVNGASGKEISVDASNASIDGKTFTHRIKFGGTGSATSRYIGIEVKAAAKIIVYAASGSGGTARDLKLTKDDGTAVGSVSVDPITKCEYTVTGAGAFSLFSGGSGINVYGIEIIYNA